MKVKKRKEIKVTIVIDETEARWLKGIMQNPFSNHEEEDGQDAQMREMFWATLDEEGIII